MTTSQLKNKLRVAIGEAVEEGMSEADAINAALDVASEWQTRVDELLDEASEA